MINCIRDLINILKAFVCMVWVNVMIILGFTVPRPAFYHFARLFKNELSTPNALYLDGTISSAYISIIKV